MIYAVPKIRWLFSLEFWELRSRVKHSFGMLILKYNYLYKIFKVSLELEFDIHSNF